jgi:hypothetical protein
MAIIRIKTKKIKKKRRTRRINPREIETNLGAAIAAPFLFAGQAGMLCKYDIKSCLTLIEDESQIS